MIRLVLAFTLFATSAWAQSADISVRPLDAPFDFRETDENAPIFELEPDVEQDTSTFGQTPETGDPIFPSRETRRRFDFDVESRSQTLRVQRAGGAVLKGLDKVTGEVVEMSLSNGEEQRLGRIVIRMTECRQPSDNPTGDAFAWVEVQSDGRETPDFAGWMIASSPALSALDHARYDVWVMRCINA